MSFTLLRGGMLTRLSRHTLSSQAMMELDSAVAKLLSLDLRKTEISPHGGSSFSSTFKISTGREGGIRKVFFMKTGSGEDARIMFEGASIKF